MVDKLEKLNVTQRVTVLKMRAATKYNLPPEKCHIGHVILEAFAEDAENTLQIDAGTGESQTNAEVATRSSQLASALRNAGLKPGDHVVIMAPNILDVGTVFYSCHYNGYGVCAMDKSNRQRDIDLLLADLRPKMVFCTKDRIELMKESLSSNKLEHNIVSFDGDYNIDAFITKYKGTEKGFRPEVFDQEKTIAWLMMTSGTTGLPKLVMISFLKLLVGIPMWWISLPVRLPAVLAMNTLQWVSTHIHFISTPLARFTRIQSSKETDSKHLREIINKYRPNFTLTIPHVLQKLLDDEGDAVDMSSLFAIVIAGSTVDISVLQNFQRKCKALVFNVYGMTELLVPIFKYPPGMPSKSSGLSVPETFKYRLVDKNGNNVTKPHEVGELWIKGDYFFDGYLNNPVETAKMITPDGWVKTGDLFTRDENNFYFFVERTRLLIRYKGGLIAPVEIEEVILQHPGVAEVCVVGIPHKDLTQLPTAAIIPKKGSGLEPSQIFKLLRETLSDGKQLHGGIFFVDKFPMTPSGKINRSRVLELALESKLITES